jgi:type IV pilus assembly protein PilV
VSLERDPENPSAPVFARRWSVWQIQTQNSTAAVRVIAVSVIYRERTLPQRREVVLYTQVTDPGAALVNASAYR